MIKAFISLKMKLLIISKISIQIIPNILIQKKEEFLAFLKYPETIRKLINSTNAVESVHSTFEKQRLKKGGFFQSMDVLNVALFIATDKLHKKWKINPLIKSKRYELNQMFVSKFDEAIL
jgi:putative transposase